MTVDEILAMGEYTDRRFRLWELSKNTRTGEDCWMVWEPFLRRTELTPAQMRLLIERDQHECIGLRRCRNHPVPNVLALQDDISGTRWGHGFGVYRPGIGDDREAYVDTLQEAMDAARALVVGE